MAEVTVTGNKKLKTLKAEFQKEFPYLKLLFCSLSDWKKATSSVSTIYDLDDDKRLSEVRTKTPAPGEKAISIHGRTLVKNLEKNFKDLYGVCVQVAYTDKDGHRYYTTGSYDEMSLTQLNKKLEELKCQKNPK